MENDGLLACGYSLGGLPFETHFHNAHELVYIRQGAARFHIGGKAYEAGPQTLVCISKLEEHSVDILRRPYGRWCVQLTPAQLARAVEDPLLRALFASRPAGFCHVFPANGAAPEAEALLRAMTEEFESEHPFRRRRLASLFALLLIACYRAGGEHFPLPPRRAGEAVLGVQAYIDAHFCEELLLPDLARRFYLSPSYLSHAFRDWTGYSPKQYIMLSRLSYARELLITTGDSIAAVAALCGFGDVNNFARSFRRETGVSPSVFRRSGGK